MANEKILVVDDDKHIRNACKEVLLAEKYGVMTADCAESGVELLKNNTFNIVITDFKMPGMDGLGVLKHVKDNYPKTDVVVITAYGTIENAVKAMKLGAYDYLTKTFDITELELIVKRCLEKQRLTEEISELKELVNLYEISKAMSSLMGLNELLDLMLKLVCDSLASDGGSIMLYDEQSNDLIVKSALGKRKNVVIGKHLPLGERIAGYAAKKEKTILIDGPLNNDPRFSNLKEFSKVGSSITVPLHRKGNLLGVINLYRLENDKHYTEQDIHLLSIFAVEASIAIENTSLFNSLSQEKEELNAVFSAMGDGAIVTDGDLNVLRLNAKAEEFLGVSWKESYDKHLPSLVVSFDTTTPWKEIENSDEQSLDFELIRKKGKALTLGILVTRILDENKKVLKRIFVLRNTTDEKREERHKMNFLALISHKLKTPLTSINGFSSLLVKKSDGLDESHKHILQSIKKQGELLNELVDNLLRFTLLESEFTKLNQEESNAENMVKMCITGLKTFTEHYNGRINIDESISKLPRLYIDEMKTIEVLENLIVNSFKFNSKEEKMVTIKAKKRNDGFVVFEVTDNGNGIPPEEKSKIFQKFYQIDEYATGQIKGAGLGLALVKCVIDLHEGEVWVESEEGKGSTFSFTLPIKN